MNGPFDPQRLQFYLTIPTPCPYLPGENCRACQSLRVKVDEFEISRRFQRTMNKNTDIIGEVNEPYATEEQFSLLKRYLTARHPHGGMAEMDFLRYEMMVEDGAANTEVVEYRNNENELIACTLIDNLSDGKSMVYSFFDPELKNRGLGNYMILDQIERCEAVGLSYLYLGYWVSESPKMSYKKEFTPAEVLTPRGWQELGSEPTSPHTLS